MEEIINIQPLNPNTFEFQEYSSEEELASLLDRYRIDVRFLGDDYIEKDYTKGSKDIPIHYLDRQHGWSTTLFKKLISQQIS